jgi:hypothetical protein
MRIIRLLTTSAATMLMVALMAGPKKASASVVLNEKIPSPLASVTNPCNGEPVLLEGFVHVLVREQLDANGGIHTTMENNPANLSGTGATTGAKYQIVMTNAESFNQQPPFPNEVTIPSSFIFVGQGGVPNFTIMFLFKVTRNANGDVTVIIVDTRTMCV